MLFFQIYGELQSLMFTETGLVWVLWVKKLLWHTLGYPYASEAQVWLIHLSYHVHLIPLVSVQDNSHQLDLSAQTCCIWSTTVVENLPGPAVMSISYGTAMLHSSTDLSFQDACPHPCYSGWVSPLCYMSCLQETVHCRHWVQKLWINNPMNSLSFNLI